MRYSYSIRVACAIGLFLPIVRGHHLEFNSHFATVEATGALNYRTKQLFMGLKFVPNENQETHRSSLVSVPCFLLIDVYWPVSCSANLMQHLCGHPEKYT